MNRLLVSAMVIVAVLAGSLLGAPMSSANAEPGAVDAASVVNEAAHEVTADVDIRADLFAAANLLRTERNLPAFTQSGQLADAARHWSTTQAVAGVPTHNPTYDGQIPDGWISVSDNVASGHVTTSTLLNDWMATQDGSANLLGDFSHMGVGVGFDVNDNPYYTVVFAKYLHGVPGEDGEPIVPEVPVDDTMHFDQSQTLVQLIGIVRVGEKIAAAQPRWTSAGVPVEGVTATYQWQRDGQPISGATAAQYTPVLADLDRRLSVSVTGSKVGYETSVQSSKLTTVAAGLLTVAAAPQITGTLKVGSKVSVKPNAWTPAPVSLTYEWLRGTTRVGTGTSYTLVAADLNKQITVRATGKKAGYATGIRTSKASAKVLAGTLKTSAPSLTGTIKVGATLSVKAGTWTEGTAKSYQWLRNGAAIKGATKTGYKLTSADAGKKISIRVTGSKPGFTSVRQVSSAKIVPKVITSAGAGFTGTVKIGNTLTAKTGAWKPAPIKLRYQWYRNGTAISGATKSTYTLRAADGGAKVSLKIAGSRQGYAAETRTSAAKYVTKKMTAVTPKISGSTVWGNKLTASVSAWKPSGITYKFQWYRNGVAVSGKTSKSYTLTTADVGAQVSVKVSGSKSGYASEARHSQSTGTVRYPSSMTPSGWDCPSWAPIKGNASSMIYHMPWGSYYSRTNPEECFSSEYAAQRAGYRASMR